MPNLDPTPDERIAWLDDLTRQSHTVRKVLVVTGSSVVAVAIVAIWFMVGFGMIG